MIYQNSNFPKALRFTGLITLLITTVYTSVFGQVGEFGNQWLENVNTSVLYKIKVTEEGIFRISHSELLAAGFPVGTINPQELQLWRRGKQISLFVSGEEDGSFDSSDFIEFYGTKNDGELDKYLYFDTTLHVQKSYSNYTDTSSYFLTTGNNPVRTKALDGANSNYNVFVSEFTQTASQVYTNRYQFGKYYYTYEGIPYEPMPFGDSGEGWFGPEFAGIWSTTVTDVKDVNTTSVFDAHIEIALVSVANGSYRTQVFYKTSSQSTYTALTDTLAIGNYQSRKVTLSVDPSTISDISNDGVIQFEVRNYGARGMVCAYINVTYPRLSTATNNTDHYKFSSSSIDLSLNMNGAGITDSSIIYEISNLQTGARKITPQFTSGSPNNLKAKFLNIHGTEHLFISDQILSASEIKPVVIPTVDTSANFIIVTHDRLKSPAEEYKTYRESLEGGSHKVQLFTVDELFNAFSYGDYSPVAIRRYCAYMLTNGTPEYLFIIGKGFQNTKYTSDNWVNAAYQFGSTGVAYRKRTNETQSVTRFGETVLLEDLVPTGGIPGSDHWFSSKVLGNETTWRPGIATGRLSALSEAEVTNYLNKVKEYEQVPDTVDWKKKVLHLSGGFSDLEIDIITSSVNTWTRIAEDQHFGADVKTIRRPKLNNQTSVTEINVSDQVNDGVFLLTFFGHSSSVLTDIDIGLASDPINQYNNGPKYPFFLMNGCNTGDCFIRGTTIGEDWVNINDRGAIGFIGHTDIGLTNTLSTYTQKVYESIFSDTTQIGKTFGQQIQRAIETQTPNAGPNVQTAHALCMLYQGDPAIKVITISKPDLAIDNNSIFLLPTEGESKVTAVSDSFLVGIALRNYGFYYEKDSVDISIRRTLPTGQIEDYPPKKYPAVKFLDTLYYTIDAKNIDGFGLNQFQVHVDYNFDTVSALGGSAVAYNGNYESSYENGNIDEAYETNNEASFQYYLPLSSVKPLFPKEFSIVSSANYPVDFIAQSTDLLTTEANYYFELDTTRYFTEPIFTAEATGGTVVTFQDIPLPLNLGDTVVFYWRVRFQEQEIGEDTLWGESSFTFIFNSSEGWSQAHTEQFFKDDQVQLNMDESNRTWSFDEKIGSVILRTSSRNYNSLYHKISLNNQDGWWQCANGGIRLIVVDQRTLAPAQVPGYSTFLNCQTNPGLKYHYRFNLNNATHKTRFQEFINDIPNGYIVALTNLEYPRYDTWDDDFGLQGILSSLGGTITNYPTSDTVSYVLVGCKGCSSPIYEENALDTLGAQVELVAVKDTGLVTSTIIGPSLGWDKFLRNIQANQLEGSDQFQFNISALDINLNDTTYYENFDPTSQDISMIPSDRYPYLQLTWRGQDFINRTPPQLNNWIVLFDDRIPEGVLITEGNNYDHKEYYQGENLQYQFKFRNISNYDFTEPLVVQYAFTNSQSFEVIEMDTLEGILEAGQEVEFELNKQILTAPGNTQLQIFVNPRSQVEQYYFNNLLQIPITIYKDNINPILEVAFDGVQIMDGDIISPEPLITMSMKDDNKKVFKTDTASGIEILWKRPSEPIFEHVDILNNPYLSFTPATENSPFVVEYKPEKLENGIHHLSVQMEDPFSNKSGVENYTIGFEVVNESMISRFYPYPNPFSTSTRFAYTLTGTQQPDQFKIQIMTLSGKMVREISQSEIGELKIGKHLTDFVWDGTDQFGDKLANGVYLYRVIAKIDNEDIATIDGNSINNSSTYNESTDNIAFKKNWGKLYIMR